MTHSPPSSKPGSKASVHTRGPKPGQKTPTTTSRTKKPPVMILCARCGVELLKSDSCSVQAGRNYSRVCQDCIGLMMGLKQRPVSLESIKSDYQESGGGDR